MSTAGNSTATVKALSIQQPWAWAIVNGHKRVENRSWATHYRGPILIHAGVSLNGRTENDLLPNGVRVPWGKLAFGAIVGYAEIDDCVPIGHPKTLGDVFAFGEHCWILKRAMKLSVSVPWRGQLGVFDVDLRAFLEAGRKAEAKLAGRTIPKTVTSASLFGGVA